MIEQGRNRGRRKEKWLLAWEKLGKPLTSTIVAKNDHKLGECFMRTLSAEETAQVSGGNPVVNGSETGGALGAAAGAAIGWAARGTLTAAAVGAAGFGALGIAVGAVFGLGWLAGTAINNAINNAIDGPPSSGNQPSSGGSAPGASLSGGGGTGGPLVIQDPNNLWGDPMQQFGS